jgi:hypothetical protein
MSRNIINNEICTASSKKFTQIEFKLDNENISTNKSAKIFNSYFINTVDELITQQQNTESVMFSLRESLPNEFPQMISTWCGYKITRLHFFHFPVNLAKASGVWYWLVLSPSFMVTI